jgi:hypothetical protein
VKERGIIFKGFLVRKILAGEKFQTRRLARFAPYHDGAPADFSAANLQPGFYSTGVPESGWVLRSRGAGGCWNDRTKPMKCPYGQPGDQLWVRETWAPVVCPRHDEGQPPGTACACREAVYRADIPADMESEDRWFSRNGYASWRPSIFMPRWASRLTLPIKSIRVERVHDISIADVWAEGFEPEANSLTIDCDTRDPRLQFAEAWDRINGKRKGGSWAENPWVFVIEWEPVKPKAETT